MATTEQFDIESLITTAKFNQSVQEQRAIERNKFIASTTVAFNGGLFTITPTLLSHLRFIIFDASQLTGEEDVEISTVLIDNNNFPIRINNCSELYAQWNAVWTKATNQYAMAHAKLKTIRTVAGIVK
jgi:hypothetical protein